MNDTPDLSAASWVTMRGEAPTGLFVRRCRLEVISGPDAGLVRELDASLIRVGAREQADVPLTDPTVSGLHVEISLTERGYLVRDLGSTNGTFVAGHRIREIYARAGTLLDMGRTRLRFEPLESVAEIPLATIDEYEGMVGSTATMRALFAQVERTAQTNATALVLGPTGAGKELIAGALHSRSTRADGPLVVVDCGALPENLIENELFGHERGAFTGAIKPAPGAFERASGGTLFLDEIGELPLSLQPALLRALESRQVRRLGGERSIDVDIRVVAATNRDLAVEVNRGRFRADLYYRLAVAELRIPALADRADDIPLLALHFARRISGDPAYQFAPGILERLEAHAWPGNVRELRNAVERLVALGADPSDAIRLNAGPATDAGSPEAGSAAVDLSVPFRTARARVTESFERAYVEQLLDAHDGNVSAAARAAKMDRMALSRLITRLGLSRG